MIAEIFIYRLYNVGKNKTEKVLVACTEASREAEVLAAIAEENATILQMKSKGKIPHEFDFTLVMEKSSEVTVFTPDKQINIPLFIHQHKNIL